MKTIPINVDRNVSKADFDRLELKVDELYVTKTFYTFQGEGPFAGYPALFVRLAGCNIGAKDDCPWCDTKFDFTDGARASFAHLAGLLDFYSAAKLVVFTGGEPMLQHTAICCFMDYYRNTRQTRDIVWQMETNGMLMRETTFSSISGQRLHYVISPKIPTNKGEYPTPRREWLDLEAHTYLKYVVSSDPESPYHTVPPSLAPLVRYNDKEVFVSGMCVYKKAPFGVASVWDANTVDQEATASNYAHAARIALQYGYRVSYQTHLFGAQE